ncbi:amidohydrolase family protein [Streptomyces canarius]
MSTNHNGLPAEKLNVVFAVRVVEGGEQGFLDLYEHLRKSVSNTPGHIVDTSPFSAAHLSLNAEVLGPERMLFGTDSPPMAAPLEDFIRMIEKLPVDEASQRLILGGNAQTLFDLRSRP